MATFCGSGVLQRAKVLAQERQNLRALEIVYTNIHDLLVRISHLTRVALRSGFGLNECRAG